MYSSILIESGNLLLYKMWIKISFSLLRLSVTWEYIETFVESCYNKYVHTYQQYLAILFNQN